MTVPRSAPESPPQTDTMPDPADPGGPPFGARLAELDDLYAAAITTLRLGFRGGALLLAAGLVLALMRREPLESTAEPFGTVLPSALRGDASGIVDLAILWMVATPVVTVLIVTIGFLRISDRRYVAMSLLALAVLCVSIALALTR